MELVSNNFGVYLTNVYNFRFKLESLYNHFNQTYEAVRHSKYISNNTKFDILNYPKYPTGYKYLVSSSTFDINKVHNICPNNLEVLLQSIPGSISGLKVTFDKIPELRELLLFDINFQKTFIETTQELYNSKKYFLNNFVFSEYDNLFFDIIGAEPPTDKLNQLDFIQQFLHFFFISTNITRYINTRTDFIDYILAKNTFSNAAIKDDFNSFINSKLDVIKSEALNISLKNIYSIVECSSSLVDLIFQSCQQNVEKITHYFNKFIDSTLADPSRDIGLISLNCLYHSIGVYTLIKLAESEDTILNTPQLSEWSGIELQYITRHIDRITTSNARPYLFLSYLYKNSAIKYVNVLSIILKQYVEDIICPQEYPSELNIDTVQVPDGISSIRQPPPRLSQVVIEGILTKYASEKLDYNNYFNLIDSDILSPDTILRLWNNNKCAKFATSLYMLDVFDKFIDSSQFKEFLEQLLNGIFTTLNLNGFVKYDHNWYKCITGLKVYFKSLFRLSIVNNTLFSSLVNELNQDISNIINNVNTAITNEIIDIPLNGVINNYYTLYQFKDDTLQVFIDGILVNPNEYTTAGSQHAIIFAIPPTGSRISVNYITSYSLSSNITPEKLTNDFINFCSIPSNSARIQKFIKNMYTSSINKETYQDILSYFII